VSDDIEFAKGIYFKPPSENAPDFVYGKISLKRQDLIDWLSDRDSEWVNLDVKESKGGKIYCAVDTWKPDSRREQKQSRPNRQGPARRQPEPQQRSPVDDFDDDDIPF
jgi:single-stranded DNA-binding protein